MAVVKEQVAPVVQEKALVDLPAGLQVILGLGVTGQAQPGEYLETTEAMLRRHLAKRADT